MREILFRGFSKNLTKNEWVFGDLVQYSENEFYILESNYKSWDILHDGILVEKESICQYTGLLDKKGNKIFEGDILQEDWFQFEVKYDTESAKFRLKSINHYQYPSWNRGIKMEIIGNIHEKTKL